MNLAYHNRRKEEVDVYLQSVQDWQAANGPFFQNLNLGVLPISGNTSESDSITLSRHIKKDYIESKVSLALGYSHPKHA